MGERTFRFGGGDLTTNVEGFKLLNGAELAEAMVTAGLLSREDADRALERRRARIAARGAA